MTIPQPLRRCSAMEGLLDKSSLILKKAGTSSTFSPSLGLLGSWILNLGLGIPSVGGWRSSRATSAQFEQRGKELEEEWLVGQRRKEREKRG